MTIDYDKLKDAPRLLLEAKLKPRQGHRFQPTGFADLGPARYTTPRRQTDSEKGDNPDRWEEVEMLLVESAQSVANRMELACCQEDRRTLLPELNGLPYVVSKSNGEVLTTSYLEAHRLSSPYLLNDEWATTLANDMKLRDNFALNDRAIFRTLLKYDPACLIHGVWLSLKQYKDKFSGGRVRVARTLSGFIEAEGISVAENGGTKFDKNFARTEEGADAETGYGTLPFHRTEFVAKEIKAYFNLDLALLRGYGLVTEEENNKLDEWKKKDEKSRGERPFVFSTPEKFLIALSLFKVRRFISAGLRLRTACDLEMDGDLAVMRPNGFAISDEKSLLEECKGLIEECKSLFANPAVTEVEWKQKEKPVEVKLPKGTSEPSIPDDLKEEIEWTKEATRKPPALRFKKALTPDIAAKAKELFLGNQEVAKAIDEMLAKQKPVGGAVGDGSGNGDKGSN